MGALDIATFPLRPIDEFRLENTHSVINLQFGADGFGGIFARKYFLLKLKINKGLHIGTHCLVK